MSQTVCTLDLNGRIVSIHMPWNGVSKTELLGSTFADYFDELSREEFDRLFDQVVELGEVTSYEATLASGNGQPQLWYSRITPRREHGEIVGAIVVGGTVMQNVG